MPRTIAAAATAALVLCTGCVQQPAPSPLPQATPTWSCTPVTGGTPYPCYENQYQEAAAQNALYESAEAVYNRFNAEDERIYRLGGVVQPTPILLETLTGEALESVMTNYRDMRSDGTRLAEGHFVTAWIRRQPENVKAGSVATLWVCNDISSIVVRQKDGTREQLGEDLRGHVYLAEGNGQLQITTFASEWVKSC